MGIGGRVGSGGGGGFGLIIEGLEGADNIHFNSQ